MGYHSSKGCHLSLIGNGLSVAGCKGLEDWFGFLHAVKLGLRQGCFHGLQNVTCLLIFLLLSWVTASSRDKDALLGTLNSRMLSQSDAA